MDTVLKPTTPELLTLDDIMAQLRADVEKLLDPKEGLIARSQWG